MVTVDKNAAYPVAMETLKGNETIAEETQLRQSKYLNNVVEQERRSIKRIVRPMTGFKSFNSVRRTVVGVSTGDAKARTEFVSQIFGASVLKEFL